MTYFMPRSSPGARASASLPSGRIVAAAAAAVLAFAVTPVLADGSHAAEIEAFASTMAIARTVRESCPGMTPDDAYLEALRVRLHIVEADHPAFAPRARAAAEVLKQGLAEARSREAWCDAVFRRYGPEGMLMRGMSHR